jgi:putative transcriptional regulator
VNSLADNMSSILDILSAWQYIFLVDRRLNNRLRVARAERNLSQDQLARLVGVTRQTISSIETGLYSPSALLAFTLAEQLAKRVDELFFLDGESR